MGNYLDFGLKIAHRGNTGSHRGNQNCTDYVSAGELMKEKAPEEYEKYSFLLTKGFERNDENILLDATRYMLDWQSEFEKDAPIFQNYQKFRDDWDAILKSYGFVKR